MSTRSEAMKPKHARRRSSVMQQPLTISNYKSKFSQLLASEESVHADTLRERSVVSSLKNSCICCISVCLIQV